MRVCLKTRTHGHTHTHSQYTHTHNTHIHSQYTHPKPNKQKSINTNTHKKIKLAPRTSSLEVILLNLGTAWVQAIKQAANPPSVRDCDGHLGYSQNPSDVHDWSQVGDRAHDSENKERSRVTGPGQNAMYGCLLISARMLTSDVILRWLLGTMAVTHVGPSVAVPCHQSVLTSGDT